MFSRAEGVAVTIGVLTSAGGSLTVLPTVGTKSDTMVGESVGTSALSSTGFSTGANPSIVGLSVYPGILPVGLKTGADVPSSPSLLVG